VKVMNTAAKCQSCQFWLPLPTFPGKGECRRFPPQVFANVSSDGECDSNGIVTDDDCAWPWTGRDQWCGEFRMKEGWVVIP
jgi:hypothetical protein